MNLVLGGPLSREGDEGVPPVVRSIVSRGSVRSTASVPFKRQVLYAQINLILSFLNDPAHPHPRARGLEVSFLKALDGSDSYKDFLDLLNPEDKASVESVLGPYLSFVFQGVGYESLESSQMSTLRRAAKVQLEEGKLERAGLILKSIAELTLTTRGGRYQQGRALKDLSTLEGNGGAWDRFEFGLQRVAHEAPNWKLWLPLTVGAGAFQVVRARTLLALSRSSLISLRTGFSANLVASGIGFSTEVPLMTLGNASLEALDGNRLAFSEFGQRLRHMTLAIGAFRLAGFTSRLALQELHGASCLSGVVPRFSALAPYSRVALPALGSLGALATISKVEQNLGWAPKTHGAVFASDVVTGWMQLTLAGKMAHELLPRGFHQYVGKLEFKAKVHDLHFRFPSLGLEKFLDRPSLVTPEGIRTTEVLDLSQTHSVHSTALAMMFGREPDSPWPSHRFTNRALVGIQGPMEEIGVEGQRVFRAYYDATRALHRGFNEASLDIGALGLSLGRVIKYFDFLSRANGSMKEILVHDLNQLFALPISYASFLTPGKALDSDLSAKLQRIFIMAEDLLNLSLGRYPKPQLAVTRREWVDHVTESLRGYPMEISVSDSPIRSFMGLIGLVLKNLVSNSLKYADPTRPLHIKIHWDGDRLVYEDNGTGIYEEHLPTLFHFGTRAGREGGEIQGTGVGTYLMGKALAAHGGQVRVDSKVGEGTRFEMTFPEIPSSIREGDPLPLPQPSGRYPWVPPEVAEFSNAQLRGLAGPEELELPLAHRLLSAFSKGVNLVREGVSVDNTDGITLGLRYLNASRRVFSRRFGFRSPFGNLVGHDVGNSLAAIIQVGDLYLRTRQVSENSANILQFKGDQVIDFVNLMLQRPGSISRVVLQESLKANFGQRAEKEIGLDLVSPFLWGRRGLVDLLLINLVGNSRKYQVPTRSPLIHLSSYPGLFIYQDHASGIPRETLPYFLEFSHRAGRDGGDVQGTGVGTWLVAKIIGDMGGSLRVVTHPEMGTRFEIRWPAKP